VESEPGRGTTFRVFLPLAPVGGAGQTLEEREHLAANRGRVALVVEDDPLVRAMATRGLAEAGYVTLEAAHGRAALELVRGHGEQIDVVVTDIGMPEMDGYQLARYLAAERPDLPVLFLSGYGDVDIASPFLQKPFSPDALVRKVGELIAPSPVRP